MQELNLENNKILSLLDAKMLKKYFKSITKLKLNNNPWNCDCSLRDVEYDNSISFDAVSLKNITCFKNKLSVNQFKNNHCLRFKNQIQE